LAVIGNLVMSLTARTATFDRNLRKSRRNVNSFGVGVRAISSQMRRYAVRILAVAGVAGLGYLIKKTMDSIDATAKLADRIGMSTESLVALQHAAQITGMESETMNKAMETFVRRLGEMRMGVGQARYSLEALNLSADDLVSKTPWENLKVIADRINGLSTAADKAAAAYYLFGRQGVSMLNLIAEGSKGIEAFRKEAERLGLTFSRFEAAQIEAANDALTRMRAVFTGIFRQVTIQLAPHIEALATQFEKMATEGVGVGPKVVNSFEQIALGAVKIGNLFEGWTAKTLAFQASSKESLAIFYEMMDAVSNLDRLLKGLGLAKGLTWKERAEELRKEAQELMDAATEYVESTYGKRAQVERYFDMLRKKAEEHRAQLVKSIAESTREATATVAVVEETTKAYRRLLNELDLEYEMLGKISEERERAKRIVRFQIELEKEFGDNIERINELMDEYAKKLDKLAAGARGPAAFNMKMEKWARDATNIWSNLGDVATGALDGMADALTEMCLRGKADFKALAASIIQDLTRMIIKAQMAQALGLVFPKLFTPMFGAPTTIPTAGVAPAWTGATMHRGGIVGVPRLHGGLRASEFPAILERGEIVLPKNARPGNVIINITNNSSIPLNVEQAVMLTSGEDIVANIVLEDLHRGGPIRRSVQDISRQG